MSVKRKRELEPQVEDTKKAARKAKRKEKKKQRAKEIAEDDLDLALGINHSFERMDSQLFTDYVNSRTRYFGKDLSSVELEDRFIAVCNIRDGSSWSQPRSTDNLSSFLQRYSSTLAQSPSKPLGAPHTLIVTASGIRAADVCRSLKSGLPKHGIKQPNVAKLFAKHMRLAEQALHLKRTRVDFGVGTPDRLVALLECKALSTANLRNVVVDVSHIDQKKRGILDMKELHEALMTLLSRKELVGDGEAANAGLVLFY